jgi:hypothetical protein
LVESFPESNRRCIGEEMVVRCAAETSRYRKQSANNLYHVKQSMQERCHALCREQGDLSQAHNLPRQMCALCSWLISESSAQHPDAPLSQASSLLISHQPGLAAARYGLIYEYTQEDRNESAGRVRSQLAQDSHLRLCHEKARVSADLDSAIRPTPSGSAGGSATSSLQASCSRVGPGP